MKRIPAISIFLASSIFLAGCSIVSNSKSQVETQIELSCGKYETATRGVDTASGREAIVQASKLARLDSGYLSFSAAITWDIAYGGNSNTLTPAESLEGQKALAIIAGLCGR